MNPTTDVGWTSGYRTERSFHLTGSERIYRPLVTYSVHVLRSTVSDCVLPRFPSPDPSRRRKFASSDQRRASLSPLQKAGSEALCPSLTSQATHLGGGTWGVCGKRVDCARMQNSIGGLRTVAVGPQPHRPYLMTSLKFAGEIRKWSSCHRAGEMDTFWRSRQ